MEFIVHTTKYTQLKHLLIFLPIIPNCKFQSVKGKCSFYLHGVKILVYGQNCISFYL